MKHKFLSATLLLIAACAPQAVEEETVARRRIDPLLDSLVAKYPNYDENELVREKMAQELDAIIDTAYNKGYLDDIPFQILSIEKNTDGHGVMVEFYSDNFDHTRSLLSDKLAFDVLGLMSEELAATLEDKKSYILHGNELARLDAGQIRLLSIQSYFGSATEMSYDPVWKHYDFNIGHITTQVDSVTLYSK